MIPSSRTRISLAGVRPGERVRIRSILFEQVRAACDGAGVREGDIVLCTGAPPSSILLSTLRGNATLPSTTARFVEVDRLEGRAPPSAAAAGRSRSAAADPRRSAAGNPARADAHPAA
jgi:hypothetical protein